jgi:hypothetical protein
MTYYVTKIEQIAYAAGRRAKRWTDSGEMAITSKLKLSNVAVQSSGLEFDVQFSGEQFAIFGTRTREDTIRVIVPYPSCNQLLLDLLHKNPQETDAVPIVGFKDSVDINEVFNLDEFDIYHLLIEINQKAEREPSLELLTSSLQNLEAILDSEKDDFFKSSSFTSPAPYVDYEMRSAERERIQGELEETKNTIEQGGEWHELVSKELVAIANGSLYKKSEEKQQQHNDDFVEGFLALVEQHGACWLFLDAFGLYDSGKYPFSDTTDEIKQTRELLVEHLLANPERFATVCGRQTNYSSIITSILLSTDSEETVRKLLHSPLIDNPIEVLTTIFTDDWRAAYSEGWQASFNGSVYKEAKIYGFCLKFIESKLKSPEQDKLKPLIDELVKRANFKNALNELETLPISARHLKTLNDVSEELVTQILSCDKMLKNSLKNCLQNADMQSFDDIKDMFFTRNMHSRLFILLSDALNESDMHALPQPMALAVLEIFQHYSIPNAIRENQTSRAGWLLSYCPVSDSMDSHYQQLQQQALESIPDRGGVELNTISYQVMTAGINNMGEHAFEWLSAMGESDSQINELALHFGATQKDSFMSAFCSDKPLNPKLLAFFINLLHTDSAPRMLMDRAFSLRQQLFTEPNIDNLDSYFAADAIDWRQCGRYLFSDPCLSKMQQPELLAQFVDSCIRQGNLKALYQALPELCGDKTILDNLLTIIGQKIASAPAWASSVLTVELLDMILYFHQHPDGLSDEFFNQLVPSLFIHAPTGYIQSLQSSAAHKQLNQILEIDAPNGSKIGKIINDESVAANKIGHFSWMDTDQVSSFTEGNEKVLQLLKHTSCELPEGERYAIVKADQVKLALDVILHTDGLELAEKDAIIKQNFFQAATGEAGDLISQAVLAEQIDYDEILHLNHSCGRIYENDLYMAAKISPDALEKLAARLYENNQFYNAHLSTMVEMHWGPQAQKIIVASMLNAAAGALHQDKVAWHDIFTLNAIRQFRLAYEADEAVDAAFVNYIAQQFAQQRAWEFQAEFINIAKARNLLGALIARVETSESPTALSKLLGALNRAPSVNANLLMLTHLKEPFKTPEIQTSIRDYFNINPAKFESEIKSLTAAKQAYVLTYLILNHDAIDKLSEDKVALVFYQAFREQDVSVIDALLNKFSEPSARRVLDLQPDIKALFDFRQTYLAPQTNQYLETDIEKLPESVQPIAKLLFPVSEVETMIKAPKEHYENSYMLMTSGQLLQQVIAHHADGSKTVSEFSVATDDWLEKLEGAENHHAVIALLHSAEIGHYADLSFAALVKQLQPHKEIFENKEWQAFIKQKLLRQVSNIYDAEYQDFLLNTEHATIRYNDQMREVSRYQHQFNQQKHRFEDQVVKTEHRKIDAGQLSIETTQQLPSGEITQAFIYQSGNRRLVINPQGAATLIVQTETEVITLEFGMQVEIAKLPTTHFPTALVFSEHQLSNSHVTAKKYDADGLLDSQYQYQLLSAFDIAKGTTHLDWVIEKLADNSRNIHAVIQNENMALLRDDYHSLQYVFQKTEEEKLLSETTLTLANNGQKLATPIAQAVDYLYHPHEAQPYDKRFISSEGFHAIEQPKPVAAVEDKGNLKTLSVLHQDAQHRRLVKQQISQYVDKYAIIDQHGKVLAQCMMSNENAEHQAKLTQASCYQYALDDLRQPYISGVKKLSVAELSTELPTGLFDSLLTASLAVSDHHDHRYHQQHDETGLTVLTHSYDMNINEVLTECSETFYLNADKEIIRYIDPQGIAYRIPHQSTTMISEDKYPLHYGVDAEGKLSAKLESNIIRALLPTGFDNSLCQFVHQEQAGAMLLHANQLIKRSQPELPGDLKSVDKKDAFDRPVTFTNANYRPIDIAYDEVGRMSKMGNIEFAYGDLDVLVSRHEVGGEKQESTSYDLLNQPNNSLIKLSELTTKPIDIKYDAAGRVIEYFNTENETCYRYLYGEDNKPCAIIYSQMLNESDYQHSVELVHYDDQNRMQLVEELSFTTAAEEPVDIVSLIDNINAHKDDFASKKYIDYKSKSEVVTVDSIKLKDSYWLKVTTINFVPFTLTVAKLTDQTAQFEAFQKDPNSVEGLQLLYDERAQKWLLFGYWNNDYQQIDDLSQSAIFEQFYMAHLHNAVFEDIDQEEMRTQLCDKLVELLNIQGQARVESIHNHYRDTGSEFEIAKYAEMREITEAKEIFDNKDYVQPLEDVSYEYLKSTEEGQWQLSKVSVSGTVFVKASDDDDGSEQSVDKTYHFEHPDHGIATAIELPIDGKNYRFENVVSSEKPYRVTEIKLIYLSDEADEGQPTLLTITPEQLADKTIYHYHFDKSLIAQSKDLDWGEIIGGAFLMASGLLLSECGIGEMMMYAGGALVADALIRKGLSEWAYAVDEDGNAIMTFERDAEGFVTEMYYDTSKDDVTTTHRQKYTRDVNHQVATVITEIDGKQTDEQQFLAINGQMIESHLPSMVAISNDSINYAQIDAKGLQASNVLQELNRFSALKEAGVDWVPHLSGWHHQGELQTLDVPPEVKKNYVDEIVAPVVLSLWSAGLILFGGPEAKAAEWIEGLSEAGVVARTAGKLAINGGKSAVLGTLSDLETQEYHIQRGLQDAIDGKEIAKSAAAFALADMAGVLVDGVAETRLAARMANRVQANKLGAYLLKNKAFTKLAKSFISPTVAQGNDYLFSSGDWHWDWKKFAVGLGVDLISKTNHHYGLGRLTADVPVAKMIQATAMNLIIQAAVKYKVYGKISWDKIDLFGVTSTFLGEVGAMKSAYKTSQLKQLAQDGQYHEIVRLVNSDHEYDISGMVNELRIDEDETNGFKPGFIEAIEQQPHGLMARSLRQVLSLGDKALNTSLLQSAGFRQNIAEALENPDETAQRHGLKVIARLGCTATMAEMLPHEQAATLFDRIMAYRKLSPLERETVHPHITELESIRVMRMALNHLDLSSAPDEYIEHLYREQKASLLYQISPQEALEVARLTERLPSRHFQTESESFVADGEFSEYWQAVLTSAKVEPELFKSLLEKYTRAADDNVALKPAFDKYVAQVLADKTMAPHLANVLTLASSKGTVISDPAWQQLLANHKDQDIAVAFAGYMQNTSSDPEPAIAKRIAAFYKTQPAKLAGLAAVIKQRQETLNAVRGLMHQDAAQQGFLRALLQTKPSEDAAALVFEPDEATQLTARMALGESIANVDKETFDLLLPTLSMAGEQHPEADNFVLFKSLLQQLHQSESGAAQAQLRQMVIDFGAMHALYFDQPIGEQPVMKAALADLPEEAKALAHQSIEELCPGCRVSPSITQRLNIFHQIRATHVDGEVVPDGDVDPVEVLPHALSEAQDLIASNPQVLADAFTKMEQSNLGEQDSGFVAPLTAELIKLPQPMQQAVLQMHFMQLVETKFFEAPTPANQATFNRLYQQLLASNTVNQQQLAEYVARHNLQTYIEQMNAPQPEVETPAADDREAEMHHEQPVERLMMARETTASVEDLGTMAAHREEQPALMHENVEVRTAIPDRREREAPVARRFEPMILMAMPPKTEEFAELQPQRSTEEPEQELQPDDEVSACLYLDILKAMLYSSGPAITLIGLLMLNPAVALTGAAITVASAAVYAENRYGFFSGCCGDGNKQPIAEQNMVPEFSSTL